MPTASVFFFLLMPTVMGNFTVPRTEVTVIGEVIDSKCYFSRPSELSTGPKHKECAIQCAKRGIPLAILEERTENVYFALKERGNSSANELLLPFVGERVEVHGRVSEKGGTRVLLVMSVERATSVE